MWRRLAMQSDGGTRRDIQSQAERDTARLVVGENWGVFASQSELSDSIVWGVVRAGRRVRGRQSSKAAQHHLRVGIGIPV